MIDYIITYYTLYLYIILQVTTSIYVSATESEQCTTIIIIIFRQYYRKNRKNYLKLFKKNKAR